jgi:hypothetical protein
MQQATKFLHLNSLGTSTGHFWNEAVQHPSCLPISDAQHIRAPESREVKLTGPDRGS